MKKFIKKGYWVAIVIALVSGCTVTVAGKPAKETTTTSTIAPVTTTTTATTTTTLAPYQNISDYNKENYLRDIKNLGSASVAQSSDASLIKMGITVCTILDSGKTVDQLWDSFVLIADGDQYLLEVSLMSLLPSGLHFCSQHWDELKFFMADALAKLEG